MKLGLGLSLTLPRPAPADNGIPDGFVAVTQGGQPVTQDSEPVYVPE